MYWNLKKNLFVLFNNARHPSMRVLISFHIAMKCFIIFLDRTSTVKLIHLYDVHTSTQLRTRNQKGWAAKTWTLSLPDHNNWPIQTFEHVDSSILKLNTRALFLKMIWPLERSPQRSISHAWMAVKGDGDIQNSVQVWMKLLPWSKSYEPQWSSAWRVKAKICL